MEDIEANESAARELPYLSDGEESTVERMVELDDISVETSDVCVIGTEGNTALHEAVLSVCQEADDSYRRIDELMASQDTELNRLNKEGYTAVGLAVHHRHETCVEHMLKHPSAHRLYLDYYPGDSEHTVRKIIIQNYPDLQPLLPAPVKESLDSPDEFKKLLASLQHNKYNIFSENLDPNVPNPSYDEPYYSTLLEIACQMKKRKQFVKLLLENGADPNIKNRVTGMPLIHATARSGNFEVLQMLLYKDTTDLSVKNNDDRTILHWLARVSERKPGDKERVEKCLKHLMRSDYNLKLGIDDRDSSGNTSLYTFVEGGFKDRAKLLLAEGADVRVLECGSKILLSASLSILENILDDCLESNDKPVTSKDIFLSLKDKLLRNIVPRLEKSQHLRDLLRHPVISTFLNLKWQVVRWFLFLDLAFYLIFLVLLTAFILCAESYNTLNERNVSRNNNDPSSFNNRYTKSGMNDTNFTSHTNNKSLHILWYFLMVFLFLLTVREVGQLIIYVWDYLLLKENWLEMLLIIATFISCSGAVENMEVKLHFSAVALLLGWVELLLLSGRLPMLAVKLEMLKTVSWTFLRFMAGYVILLIAFALSFYILFKGSLELGGTEMFANPHLSILKTIIMFAGEFEASSLSFYNFPYTSHVIFLLFLVLVAIVLLNLLNGLAVSDTDAIRKKAETLSLVARVSFIQKIEKLFKSLPRWMRCSRELPSGMRLLYPNKSNSKGSAEYLLLLNIISKKRQSSEKHKSTEDQVTCSIFTEKFSALQLQMERLEKKFDKSQEILMRTLDRLDLEECETTHL